jgi:hypothetical protein
VGAAHDVAGATTTAARPPVATGELKADSPQLLRSLPDRAVLYKPEGLAWAIVGDMYVINYVHFIGDFSEETKGWLTGNAGYLNNNARLPNYY